MEVCVDDRRGFGKIRIVSEGDSRRFENQAHRARLMANGVTAKGVRAVYPSITYPNHTTLVTGALPEKHGIFGNNIFESPLGEKTGAGIWFAKNIKAETLWTAAKRGGLTTGLVSYSVAGGAGDWNVPEIKQDDFVALFPASFIAKKCRFSFVKLK